MATNTTQKQAAKQFVQDWSGKGYEKGETARFWIALLQNVYGIQDATKFMEFELPVKTILKEKGSDFIDGYIASTKVLIEQKGSKVDLTAKYRQSDGSELTPYQQARRYSAGLPVSMTPHWIVVCNFTTFEVHDMEHPNDAPEVIQLADLEKEYHRLSFLVDDTNVHLKKELEVSIQAGEIVGVLYDKILSQYKDPENPETQKALNKLCVRLVFCLYAEDAGIFGSKNMFHDYMAQFSAADFREKLIKLFRILDQKPENRDPYEDEALLAFPYVNGGLFSGDIEIPRINEEIRQLILQRASDDFDWSLISPTIFGAVFESTLNPETRRAGGMHYTSIENIHKVIDPLFLDDLKAELADIRTTTVAKVKKEKALAFQDKISKLKFFDPACGSGNFLTESYTSLRRLENEVLRIIYGQDRVIGEFADPIKVSINQFYGIEINDFACSVAQTALWIAESQMLMKTDEIVGFNLDPLPLKTYTNIHEGNALRLDWNEVVPASELNYIMGNPPFVGTKMMNQSHKEDTKLVIGDWKNYGVLDYVACWYRKSIDYISGTNCRAALVSTNSITQGEQVAALWRPLFNSGIHIDFAYRTFVWDSEATEKAHVHCVIIGFSRTERRPRKIYDGAKVIEAKEISPYLIDGSPVFVEGAKTPISKDAPTMYIGCDFKDDGNYVLTEEEKDELIKKEPNAIQFIRPYMMGKDFIDRSPRYCIWLKGASPAEIRKCPEITDRIKKVQEFRLACPSPDTNRYANYPMLPVRLCYYSDPKNTDCIALPKVSSQNRRYLPMDILKADYIAGCKLFLLPDISTYHFGVLMSIAHMAWMRTVCGRMKSDYSYSSNVVYNTFPWPQPSEEKKEKISRTAQAILDARALYPDSSLADLYDDLTMPTELRRAHNANDVAVLEAYGFPRDASESDIVGRLFKMYQDLTK